MTKPVLISEASFPPNYTSMIFVKSMKSSDPENLGHGAQALAPLQGNVDL